MITTIDEDRAEVIVNEGAREIRLPLGSAEGFEAVSRAWLRAGWDTKYVYSFTWMGRPIIQLPEDMIRIQEVIYQIKPSVLIETGIAHGGSLIFYASLFKAMGHGRVIGIDVDIREHNRRAIEAHELSSYLTLIEGSSTEPRTVELVASQLRPGERTLILLDSNHTYEHVLAELNAYASMVSVGSYIVAMDGIMKQVSGAPRTNPDWEWNNPIEAVNTFLQTDKRFQLQEPKFQFNEGVVKSRVTYWPSAYIKRVS